MPEKRAACPHAHAYVCLRRPHGGKGGRRRRRRGRKDSASVHPSACSFLRDQRDRELREAAAKVVSERKGLRNNPAAADQVANKYQWAAAGSPPTGTPVRPRVGQEAVSGPARHRKALS